MLEVLPTDVVLWARGWDLAATSEDENGEPAYTAGVLIGKRKNGRYIVADVINRRLDSAEVRELIKMTCIADKAKYGRVITRLPQDPGQAGKAQAQSFLKFLSGTACIYHILKLGLWKALKLVKIHLVPVCCQNIYISFVHSFKSKPLRREWFCSCNLIP